MKTEIKLTIPKHKIAGLRIGQLIYNAIRSHWRKKHGAIMNDEIADYLFNVENSELQEMVDEYLGEHKEK